MSTASSAVGQAVQDAAAEHSAPVEQAVAPTDQADQPNEQQPPVEEKGADTAPSPEESVELLGEDEWQRLQKDPKALRKALNKAATAKFQELARERESLKPLQQLAESLQTDPQATLRTLASQYGLTLAEAKQAVEEAQQQQGASVIDALRQSLGPDLGFVADALAPVLGKVDLVEQELRQQQAAAAKREDDALMAEFKAKHPDWNKHAFQIAKLIQEFPPPGNRPSAKYLDHIMRLAKPDVSEAEAIQRYQERVKAASAKAETSASGVPAQRVARKAPENLTVRQAMEDAAQGIIYE